MYDDIDRKWPAEILINDLSLPLKARQCLSNRFCSSKFLEISLRDIMDFLVIDYETMPRSLYTACPAFQQKNVGLKTYMSLVEFFSGNDFGRQFNLEWRKRLRKLLCFKKQIGYVPNWLSQYNV